MPYNTYDQSRFLGAPVEIYRFVTRDGLRSWLYTSSDEPITLTATSETYQPEQISRGAVPQSLSETPAVSMEIVMGRSNPIAAEFVAYLPISPITVLIRRLHRNDPDQELRFVFSGEISSAGFKEDDTVSFNCFGASEAMRRRIPWQVYQTRCVWPLYSPQCGINKETFRTDAAIISASGTQLNSAAFSSFSDGWFSAGFIESAAGEVRFIESHVSSLVTVSAPFTVPVTGTTVKAYAGCNRSAETCRDKFSNVINFLGWPRIPTRNPFETSIT